ncbi:MAG: tRNA glutamyl-Q(34) synthetase GluQRS [Oceanicaulis sp.]|uniref:tRNA glutamyl-Q(34) synthetase GluQRS n=1 Tax=Glycocaulis sp. TaxID=1969725 RepID=UPI0025B931AD|nr:tRNA glutamyl-Q(34) synthetase GluQRS [Glycocaulis sp.]MCC5980532.1 tRNA glutamyl-Q(34) synthetase GluQRS [Oceanicaulis sp.]MCH8521495.1 tRNA glutamyl-Q(34) synthetase GluQRS [Glycocaulis sp.]
MTGLVTRFAPSPTGLLHLGHAYAAGCAFGAAKEAGGICILRIEDIDATRCGPEFETAIMEDLRWLSLDWPELVRRQSDHLAEYKSALDRLIEGGLAYRCFKTRKEVAEAIASAPHEAGEVFVSGPLPPAGERALLDAGQPYAWRLSLEAARAHLGTKYDALAFTVEASESPHDAQTVNARPELLGDVVIARKDAGTSYHLASVHDDALQGVTHVIRGVDLAGSAHIHRLLQALLDYPPVIYRHHPLLTGPDGRRYAKRDRAVTLRALREAGHTPEDIGTLISQHIAQGHMLRHEDMHG